jgi:ribosomal protein L24E
MKLVCYYCSKEIVMPGTLGKEEEKLKGSIWFCSDYCKEAYLNIQLHRKRGEVEEEKEELQ